MGVVFITHDMGVVAEVADRVLVMYRGDKVEDGPLRAGVRGAAACLYAGPAVGRAAPGCDAGHRPAAPLRAAAGGRRGRARERERRQPAGHCAERPAADPAREGSRDPLRAQERPLQPRDARGARGGAGQLRPACRRDAGAGRRIGLRQVHHRPLAAAPGREPGRQRSSSTAATSLQLPAPASCRRSAQHPDDLPGPVRLARSAAHRRASRSWSRSHARRRERRAKRSSACAGCSSRSACRPTMRSAIRTSSPAASASASRSRARSRSIPRWWSPTSRCRRSTCRSRRRSSTSCSTCSASSASPILFISHDMAVVERISHRVAVMYLGQIVEIGPRRAIFENPQHAYTRKLMAAVPVADPARRRRERQLHAGEIPSPMRAVGDEPGVEPLRRSGPGPFRRAASEWAHTDLPQQGVFNEESMQASNASPASPAALAIAGLAGFAPSALCRQGRRRRRAVGLHDHRPLRRQRHAVAGGGQVLLPGPYGFDKDMKMVPVLADSYTSARTAWSTPSSCARRASSTTAPLQGRRGEGQLRPRDQSRTTSSSATTSTTNIAKTEAVDDVHGAHHAEDAVLAFHQHSSRIRRA